MDPIEIYFARRDAGHPAMPKCLNAHPFVKFSILLL